MRFKILAVDFELKGKNIDQISFSNKSSFTDYDVVIIDPYKIFATISHMALKSNGSVEVDSDFGKSYSITMGRRAEETKLLLEKAGGIVVCFLRAKEPILRYILRYKFKNDYIENVHCYSWLPSQTYFWHFDYKDISSRSPLGKAGIKKLKRVKDYKFSSNSFNPTPRYGSEIKEIDKTHSFSQYFSALRGEIYFETVINNTALIEIGKPIAKNKVGEVVALELPFGQGKFIFLPPLAENSDIEKVSGILIDCIQKSLHWTQPFTKPVWASKYELPGDSEVEKESTTLQGKMMELEKKKQTIGKRKIKLEMLRGLLYEQGKYKLEPSVREAFRILDFQQVLEPEEYEEEYDLYIKEKDLKIIGEVEGTNKQVDVKKYRQLLDYIEAEIEKDKNVKGILIGNGFSDIDPKKRTEQFTPQAISGCKRRKFCRMTTYELFKAARAVLSNPCNKELKESIRKKILRCNDEFKYQELKK